MCSSASNATASVVIGVEASPFCLISHFLGPISHSVFSCASLQLAPSWSPGFLSYSQISLEVLPGASEPLNSSFWPRMLFPLEVRLD